MNEYSIPHPRDDDLPFEKLTPEAIRYYRNKGRNQSEIANIFGVTKQAVSSMAHRHGIELPKTPRAIALEQFPWTVPAKYQDTGFYRRMADHTHYIVNGPGSLTAQRVRLLKSFYQRLRDNNVVVEYDPGIPPSPDCKAGAWRYVVRKPSDGDLMIRVNEYTTVTDESLWRIPSVT